MAALVFETLPPPFLLLVAVVLGPGPPRRLDLVVWQYRLWSFQVRDTKLERFLAKNQLESNEIIEF